MKDNSFSLFVGIFYALIALLAFDVIWIIVNFKPWIVGTP
jgi:hypothetical protein